MTRRSIRIALLAAVTLWTAIAPAQTTAPATQPTAPVKDDTATSLLKAWIAEECPTLNDARTTDWERVSLLRDWAHRHLDWASPSALLESDANFNIQNRSAADLFAIYQTDRGGVWCGGAAVTLRKLYEAYGLEAVTLDCGFPDSQTTHVMTIVKVNHKGKALLVLEDPTFNYTYIDGKGEPADVVDLMESIKKKEDGRYFVRMGPIANLDFLVDPKDVEKLRNRTAWINRITEKTTLPDGRWKFRVRMTVEEYMVGPVAEAFRSHGYPLQLRYLLLHPLWIAGSADSDFDRLAAHITPATTTVGPADTQPADGSKHLIAQVLKRADAAFLASNVAWRDDGLMASGRAENRYTYLATFAPTVLGGPRELVVQGELTSGGVTVGVTRDGQWYSRMNIMTPGPFHSAITITEPGVYTVIVANNLVSGPVQNEFKITAIGWSAETPQP
ncbi:MAG: hypothetical protein K8S99_07495 [Planctomycetes bacterium]|nr:hypothetical protein [Planctomycetota bacterium]